MTALMFERVLEGHGKPLTSGRPGFMSYIDFVWFILCVENKSHFTSIEYWFRVLDFDSDGVLSLWELKRAWEEQSERMMDNLGRGDRVDWTDYCCMLYVIVLDSSFPLAVKLTATLVDSTWSTPSTNRPSRYGISRKSTMPKFCLI